MVERLLCSLLGHVWNRSLRLGHPNRQCLRCELREWATSAAARLQEPAHVPPR